ncbi:hypothetical protein BS47DRAFT_1416628 [Hydnum rufescens UP504]|uniref:Uncharacterized protein n=1 Tax=Hydnum rufescens UP504 TaxID=1448309 RepID=A0A9P6DMZ5_9AGAM|nr:hypothetical protein BS47DRAFT_1416628 [Hydnum rufescens UP504]
MYEPIPPNYFLNHWLHKETWLPISFKHLIPPEKFPPTTPLLSLQPLPLAVLHNKEFEVLYSRKLQPFNKIQTQVFQALYNLDDQHLHWCTYWYQQNHMH